METNREWSAAAAETFTVRTSVALPWATPFLLLRQSKAHMKMSMCPQSACSFNRRFRRGVHRDGLASDGNPLHHDRGNERGCAAG